MNGLTLRQVRIYSMREEDVQQIGSVVKTRAGRKAMIEPAVENLLAGKRWDAR